MFWALILAAGSSTRMNGQNKQLLTVGGEPVILRSVRAFQNARGVEGIFVAVKEGEKPVFDRLFASLCREGGVPVSVIPSGGETRRQTVEKSLSYLPPRAEYIAIHDGARPLVRTEDIERTFAACRKEGGAVLGTLMKDTVKVLKEDGFVEKTPDRSALFAAQTPQVFALSEYQAALKELQGEEFECTDDAQLFERTGRRVAAVIGHFDNIKITTSEDVAIAEALLRQRGD